MPTLTAYNEEETERLAADIAPQLRPGWVVTLKGDLGMGKSVFARALIRTLTGTPDLEVPSPTYTIVQTYAGKEAEIWHYDLYRISEPEEIHELGWDEARAHAITLVEWPGRLEGLAPAIGEPGHISIIFEKSRDLDPEIPGGSADSTRTIHVHYPDRQVL